MADKTEVQYLHCTKAMYHTDEQSGNDYLHLGYSAAFVEIDPETLIIGFTMCGANDVFCKRLGRIISKGRMEQTPYTVKKMPSESARQAAREFCDELYFGESIADPVPEEEMDYAG